MADDNKELTWQEKQDAKRKENEQKRQARSQQYSNEAIDAAAKWMEDNQVDSLDEQSISSILTPKQLWHFQKNNRNEGAGSNWGNAFGSHVFFGDVNDGTVSLLNKKALEKKNANVAQANKDRVSTAITKAVPYGDATINISNKNIDDMRLWGDNIKDSDNISAEQAVDLYSRLESMGVAVPKKDIPLLDKDGKPQTDKDGNPLTTKVYDLEGKTSLYDLLDDLDADEALGVLGLLDDTGYVTPHHETFEEKLARAERNREKLELLNKQRALQRQQARLGMADLAAGIGDMIKASGGAIVDPRDYKAMYDTLTAQQQKNFDNYLARMQKMKDEEKAKQLLKEERLYKEKQDQIQRDWTSAEYEKNRQGELLAASVKAGSTSGKESVDTAFNGKKYTFKNKDTYTSAMHSIFGIIKNAITDAKGNLKPPYSTTFANLDGKVPQSEIYSVIAAAAMDTPAIRKQYGKQINETLKAYTGIAGNPIKEEETSETVTTTTTGKKYRNAQGVEISEEEYNNLSILVKPLYQEVK